MKILFLSLYLLCSIIHLYFSWKNQRRGRAVTKPFLLILLILFYVFSVDKVNIFLLLALFTSWLGDVLLIPKGHKWFVYGGISFIFCHLFFIAVYFNRVRLQSWPIVLPMAILYYGIALKVIFSVQDNTPKAMLPAMYFYLLCNSTMNVFALLQLLNLKNKAALIAYIGAVLFYISDCCLYLVRYHKNTELIFKKHFTVMLTYLSGELLITLGIIMLGG